MFWLRYKENKCSAGGLLCTSVCRTHDLTIQTRGQCRRSWESLEFLSALYSFMPGRALIKFWSNVSFSEMMCRIDISCRLKVKVTIEGHKFEPLILSLFHISFTKGGIFIKL